MKNTPSDFRLDAPFYPVGTAISRFQVQPLPKVKRSDWSHQLDQARKGLDPHFEGPFDPECAPNYDRDEKQILVGATELNPENTALKTTFRFSIDPSEVCPDIGVFDEQAMVRYVRTLARCHFLGLEPMITLHHWTLPKALATFDQNNNIVNGPLEHPKIVQYFAFFVEKLADFLCDPQKIKAAVQPEGYNKKFIDQLCDEQLICRWFITLNEPLNMIFTPYINGVFPPYKKWQWGKYDEFIEKLRAMHRIAHETLQDKVRTASIPKYEQEKLQMGMAHTMNDSLVSIPVFEQLANLGLLERMEDDAHSEFTGVQYYCRIRIIDILAFIGLVKNSDPEKYCDHPDFTTIDPEGVYRVFRKVSKKYPHKNFMLSEFGAADKEDQRRPYWILETLRHLIRAKQEGINIKGVLLWTLINNWEWMRGMTTAFGLHDHRGQRLTSDMDDEQYPSSRLVWQHAVSHLMDPNAQKQQELVVLRNNARKQCERFVSLKRKKI